MVSGLIRSALERAKHAGMGCLRTNKGSGTPVRPLNPLRWGNVDKGVLCRSGDALAFENGAWTVDATSYHH